MPKLLAKRRPKGAYPIRVITVPPFFAPPGLASNPGELIVSLTAGVIAWQNSRVALSSWWATSPKLAELTDEVLFGDVWTRPGLARRDRSLITVAALTALGRTDQLRSHLGLALDNGVTREELAELATHLAFYAGWPAGMTAATTLRQVLDAR
jgi:4-carboxymuconolactone decarboxylase